MSERNGDKSRFNRLRKQRILQRKRNRELRKALGLLKLSAAKERIQAVRPKVPEAQ